MRQPRQGRNIIAQGESPGRAAPTPFCSPSPPGGGRGLEEGLNSEPTAGAVGYMLPPLTGLPSYSHLTSLLQRPASCPRLSHLSVAAALEERLVHGTNVLEGHLRADLATGNNPAVCGAT